MERWVSLRFLGSLKTAAELPLKKVAEPLVKKYFLRKGFLNSR
jgi:hypothetical protein